VEKGCVGLVHVYIRDDGKETMHACTYLTTDELHAVLHACGISIIDF